MSKAVNKRPFVRFSDKLETSSNRVRCERSARVSSSWKKKHTVVHRNSSLGVKRNLQAIAECGVYFHVFYRSFIYEHCWGFVISDFQYVAWCNLNLYFCSIEVLYQPSRLCCSSLAFQIRAIIGFAACLDIQLCKKQTFQQKSLTVSIIPFLSRLGSRAQIMIPAVSLGWKNEEFGKRVRVEWGSPNLVCKIKWWEGTLKIVDFRVRFICFTVPG